MNKPWSVYPYYVFGIYEGNYYNYGTTFTAETVTANTYRKGTLWTMSDKLCKLVVF